jgi:hypothetical protein
LDPPPIQPYPVNEVLAEATDLDGNRVLLRRGYYDARTGLGFGWDKMYWKHGIVNMNVFKDLISHSRPIRNDGEDRREYQRGTRRPPRRRAEGSDHYVSPVGRQWGRRSGARLIPEARRYLPGS